jgi:SSS family solute:Na+ symporter
MKLGFLDIFVLVASIVVVYAVSLWASRKEESAEDYFLAGRQLAWPLIGMSLIASNISTEHFVGMAGRGYDLGLAIASYEWMAAVTLVIVAIFFLPRFLRSGIYTMPQFLELRFNLRARTIMSAFMLLAYIFVGLAAVLYSGALALATIFDLPLIEAIWLIGILTGIYTVWGGLKAVVWSDFLQGIALLLGGLLVTVLAFHAVGGIKPFLAGAGNRLHTVLPWNHPEMPWVAVFFGGLWIPNLFYWGLNQFITQRTLGARSLADGQRGIIMAAWIKLAIPFLIVFPGILAAELYGAKIANPDQAYPYMIRELLPNGLRGAMLAALLGAVMSSLSSMLNSASTIFTIDFYQRHFRPEATQKQIVTVGRLITAACVIIACLWAPAIARFGSVFQYMQMIWGFISPGIVTAFLFGLFSRKAPPLAASAVMLLGIPVYGGLLVLAPPVAFLHHMMLTFFVRLLVSAIITAWKPLREPVVMPVQSRIDMTPAPGLYAWAGAVITATAVLYVIFW